jgi:naphthalene 1,2-dioxygenase ferredoxin component
MVRRSGTSWKQVAAAADVPEDGTLLVRHGSEPVCLYNLAGTIYATHDVCTHGQASLADGFIQGEDIECPLHQGLFHIPTGKAVGAPCTEDLRVYPVKVEDGAVYIESEGELP